MATIDYLNDWEARMRSRLFTQFRDAETWQQWVEEVLSPQFQELEDAAQTILTILDIDGSSGVQLDVIGRIIGQARLTTDDATYRLYLRARILANRSTGTTENIYDVLRALYGQTAGLHYVGGFVKQFSINVDLPLTRTQALVGVLFLLASKEAGARGLLEWQESASSVMFTFDGTASPTGLGFDVGYFAGAAQA